MADKDTNVEKWVNKHGDALYSYAITRVFNPEIAEDLVQDTFLSAIKAITNFQHKSSIKTWLISILKRKIIDYFRKKSTTHEKLTENITQDWKKNASPFVNKGPLKGTWKDNRVPGSWSVSEDNSIESEEFYKILNMCLSFLPPKWASCFTLKVIEEYSTEEICKEINISSSNLWVMLHRARLQLRECMEKNWLEE